MKLKLIPLAVCAVLLLPAGTPAEAQTRSAGRTYGGFGMIAAGAFMMLGSGTCDPGEPYSVSAGNYLVSFTSPGATGGTFPWTPCRLTGNLRIEDQSTGWVGFDGPFDDSALRTIAGDGTADNALARARKRRPAMLYGGVGVAAAGVLLATVFSAADEPSLDLHASPRGVRFSKTFGF